MIPLRISLLSFFLLAVLNASFAQIPLEEEGKGLIAARTFNTEKFIVETSKTLTISRLSPVEEPEFDFIPDRSEYSDSVNHYQLGDINLSIKHQKEWRHYSSAKARNKVKLITVKSKHDPIVADISESMGDSLPVRVVRTLEIKGGDVQLGFNVTNITKAPVEIGALGVPMIFNNNLSGKSLEEAHAENVFYDPYIGKDAGYLQAVRLHGHGPVLLVVPKENAAFEAYRPLHDDPTPRGITFEGFHEWMVHSRAYAANEWKDADQWNEPTATTLAPGATKSYSWRLTLAPSVREIEHRLQELEQPVAMGVPGYVLPMDVHGSLMVHYPKAVQSIDVTPDYALSIEQKEVLENGFVKYAVKGLQYGKARVTITYTDGLEQTIHYKVIRSETETVNKLGEFLTNEQWYDAADDPFGRSPSVMSYDYETKEIVKEDSRAWIVGLGDEGGSGPYLAAMMKQLIQPEPAEINKLIRFIDETLWGGIQYSAGPQKYGVRKSLFYYEPDSMPAGTYDDNVNYNTWAAWSKEHAESTGRSYNYPHVTAAHWVMYRLARYRTDLVKNRSWEWYLEHGYHTAMAMVAQAGHYAQFGQMEGTIFVMLLKDLKKEGFDEMANNLEDAMKKRADHWKSLAYPFGSEMPWDSTGQEEVYMWSRYFGYDKKAEITLNAILAYMPTLPHWGYNGSARRYWDFLYGGKITRIERQLHHYGSALNAIPVLHEYRSNPTDLHLLRVGHAGMMGGIANVTRDGFGPAAFHSYPSTLQIDPLSGDYGSGFFGYAINNSSYLVKDETFGWLGFGGNVSEIENEVSIRLTSAAKSRVFIQPANLWITLQSGQMQTVNYNMTSQEISITFSPKNDFTPRAYFEITSADNAPQYSIGKGVKRGEIGAYVKLKKKPVTITLRNN